MTVFLSGEEQKRAKALTELFNRSAAGAEFDCGEWTVLIEKAQAGMLDARIGVTCNGEAVNYGSAPTVANALARQRLTCEAGQLVQLPDEPKYTPEIKPAAAPVEETMPRGIPNSGVRKPRGSAAKKTAKATKPAVSERVDAEAVTAGKSSVAPPQRPLTGKPARRPLAAMPSTNGLPAPSKFSTERQRILIAREVLDGQEALLDRLEASGE